MKNFIQWLIVSSVDPGKVSLTVRGFLMGIIPTIIMFAGLAHISIPDQATITSVVDTLAQIVQVVLGIVASITFVVGAIRKLWHTFAGTNQVINAQRTSLEG